jgi:hypothetical protein
MKLQTAIVILLFTIQSLAQQREGLSSEDLDRIDKEPSSNVSEDKVILPNGKTLSNYKKERGINLKNSKEKKLKKKPASDIQNSTN